MSFAACKMMHPPTGIDNCASGFITHSVADFTPKFPPIQTDDLDSDWPSTPKPIGPLPNLILTSANVLELYTLRLLEEAASRDSKTPIEAQRGGVLAGISGASLELVCHYRSTSKLNITLNCTSSFGIILFSKDIIAPNFFVSFLLLTHCRLHGNVESMGILSSGGIDGGKRRDSIILTFQDAKMSVLEFDDSIHGLRTRSVKKIFTN